MDLTSRSSQFLELGPKQNKAREKKKKHLFESGEGNEMVMTAYMIRPGRNEYSQ